MTVQRRFGLVFEPSSRLTDGNLMSTVMNQLQRLGRALMLPIAVLPIAGLLLRLGQPDLLGLPVLAAAGDAVFANLGLIFAVGVAVGLARENHGAAGLASLVGFLIATKGADALLSVPDYVTHGLTGAAAAAAGSIWKTTQLAKLTMPVGILSGVMAGIAYNRFSDIKLPDYLAFFAGRRFVPIVTGCLGVGLAVVFGLGWPWLAAGIDAVSQFITGAGDWGLFLYGFLNRLLIVTGLHHILNNLAWFLLGDYHGVTGDLNRFFAGDPEAGRFMTGFFPVMMFGLPGACLAMYRAADPARRVQVGGLLLSIALTSFLTGVTEPIEFSFMFLAPFLYAIHAVLTGVSMVVMHVLNVRLGFSFSAGLFDYVLNFGKASHPLRLLPVGMVYFGLYFVAFRWAIVRYNLGTPGRDAVSTPPPKDPASTAHDRADDFIAALGGAGNLQSVDACTTRLRLIVVDSQRVDADALSRLGAMGVVKPSPTAAQVILGPVADQIASTLRRRLGQSASPATGTETSSSSARVKALPLSPLCEFLGGRDNIASVRTGSSRLILHLRDIERFRPDTPLIPGVRGVGLTRAGAVHLLLDRDPESTAEALVVGGVERATAS